MNTVAFLNNSKSKPTTVAEHFLSSSNRTPNDMQLIPIEKVFSNRDAIWKAREAFLKREQLIMMVLIFVKEHIKA